MGAMTGTFDASQYAPKQVGTTHPVGKFPATISNTSIEPTQAGTGGMFIVEFTTQAGSIVMRYNLWNPSPQAVSIANGQLSALCHATGIFKIQYENDGAALRGAQCQIEVVDQIDKETKLPNGYTQVKRVFDRNGNEPGKPPQQPQTAQQQPSQQNWQPPAPNPAPSPSPAWGNTNAGQVQQPTVNPNPAWQPGPSVGGQGSGPSPAPPWAQK